MLHEEHYAIDGFLFAEPWLLLQALFLPLLVLCIPGRWKEGASSGSLIKDHAIQ